jgi:hypothetical protein
MRGVRRNLFSEGLGFYRATPERTAIRLTYTLICDEPRKAGESLAEY